VKKGEFTDAPGFLLKSHAGKGPLPQRGGEVGDWASKKKARSGGGVFPIKTKQGGWGLARV